VPSEQELRERLDRLRTTLAVGARRTLDRARETVLRDGQRLDRAPSLLLERKRAGLEGLAGRLGALSPKSTLARGYAIVRTEAGIVRSAAAVAPGTHVDVELGEGGFGALVDETRA
jgi:exodeoxyribonuclease VII large subunit